MNWDALGAMGEIAGAIAVIATLFFLARQLQVNTRELEKTNFQAITLKEPGL